MGGSPRLEQRQSQSVTLTPQLQAALKLLTLSSQDLSAYIEQALCDNPLLSVPDSLTEAPSTAESPTQPDPFEYIGRADYENLWTHSADATPPLMKPPAFDPYAIDSSSFLNEVAAKPITLREHLRRQLRESSLDAINCFIGFKLIDALEPTGYLTADLSALAGSLGCSTAQVAVTLSQLKQFEPAGVFAENLSDCLRLQLQDQQKLTPLFKILLDNLTLMEKGDLPKLCKIIGVDQPQLISLLQTLRSLDPKPGLQFEYGTPETLIPDVYVVFNPIQRQWEIKLNEAAMPRLLVERGYLLGTGGRKKPQDSILKNYLKQHLSHAQWLIKALEQRVETITAVAGEIVRVQADFFDKGVAFLKPLVLKDIALALNIHESTVSRITTQKYMATSRGVFEFKYFFSRGLLSEQRGEDVSAQTIKHALHQLVKTEPAHKPHSDDDLVHLLAQQGITVARRTVAKYRTALNISSSYKRQSAWTAP